MTVLSIIVPVFKVEQTLERCLKSIANQSFRDWEAILVDDGSPDNCPSICDEWAKRDSRFRVIHKSNGGLSDARNAGIDLAEGKFITFVDSDDYLATDTYQQLFHQLDAHPEYDILEYSLCKIGTDGKRTDITMPDREFSDMRKYWLEGEAFKHCYAWNKIYRKELFAEVRYPVGRLFEDTYVLPLLLEHASIVATTSLGCYYYVENPKSITALAKGNEWQALLDAHMKAVSRLHLLEHPEDDSTKILYASLLNIQLYTYMLTKAQPRLPQLHISTLPAVVTRKERIKISLNNILGINKLCKLFRTLHRLTKSH